MLTLLTMLMSGMMSALPADPSKDAASLGDKARPSGVMVSSIGQAVDLDAAVGKRGTVYAFLSTECPISNGYVPSLNRLVKEYTPQGIEFVGLNPNDGPGLKDIEFHRIRYGIQMTVVRDPSARLAHALGVTHCPEVVVFDANGVLVYRGRIDDRYPRRGGAPNQVVHSHDLESVVKSLSAGEVVAPRETEVVGCPVVATIPDGSTADPAANVTFTRDVLAILQKNCQECHREGGIGPFELTSYEDAALWASDIAVFTANRTMPPWKLVEGHGEFQDVRRLADAEIDTIRQWVDAGCPKGDPADAPQSPTYSEGWKLGKPDVILEMTESYTLDAEGPDEYRHFVIPTNFDEDLYVTALEVYAGNPRVDHHVIVFLDPTGVSEKLDAADPKPGYLTSGGWPGYIAPGALGGWAPGAHAVPLPDGVARVIPKGSRVVLQMHYHKSGRPEVDRTKIGFYTAKEKPRRLLLDAAITPLSALPMLQSLPIVAGKIPADDPQFTVRQTMWVPEDIDLLSVRPHMHLIGKEMKVTATLPDGTTQPIVFIRNWDFNWQETYYYKSPVRLPKDTRLDLSATFDNSKDNPANPNSPPKPVSWGEGTTDEMAFCFFEMTKTTDAVTDEDLKIGAATDFIRGWVDYQVRGPHSPLHRFLTPKPAKGNKVALRD